MSRAAGLLILFLAMLFAGCRRDMFDQPKVRPLRDSQFFTDGRSARPVPAGTFEYTDTDSGEAITLGTTNGNFVATIPIPVDDRILRRGRERFDIYCSPCHGRVGDGRGMIARRGFIQPANLHNDRVRNAPPGYIYAVIAHGYGSMPEYGDQVPTKDRWAIVAYIRALELSRRATVADVPPENLRLLETSR
ncbi:MAG: cytochrome c [Bryobacteraceae bacterium]